jgi:hypothetical protein
MSLENRNSQATRSTKCFERCQQNYSSIHPLAGKIRAIARIPARVDNDPNALEIKMRWLQWFFVFQGESNGARSALTLSPDLPFIFQTTTPEDTNPGISRCVHRHRVDFRDAGIHGARWHMFCTRRFCHVPSEPGPILLMPRVALYRPAGHGE